MRFSVGSARILNYTATPQVILAIIRGIQPWLDIRSTRDRVPHRFPPTSGPTPSRSLCRRWLLLF
jgi:hypothetical protein